MERSQVERVLKRDVFGRVELDDVRGTRCIRRVASGSSVPFSKLIARRLLAREKLALEHLAGLAGVPRIVEHDGAILVRSYVAGEPLSQALSLPENFFDELDALVAALHARGVCHNDLHKEQNVLVDERGYPWLVDFQLASVHALRDARFDTRAAEDLRHVEKHRRRYTRDGRGPNGVRSFGSGANLRRSLVARVWRRVGKPVYNALTRKVLRQSASEPRRASSGPWPQWVAAIAPRAFGRASAHHRMSSR